MTTSIPLPAGLPLDAASWERTRLVVRQLVVQLLTVIQQQAVQITAFEARASQHSQNSDRPPSSDPPYAKHPVRAGGQGRLGGQPGHPGHRQARLEPTDVIEVRPKAYRCGQREFPATTPYHIHQVIELPESTCK
jgi:transposase